MTQTIKKKLKMIHKTTKNNKLLERKASVK